MSHKTAKEVLRTGDIVSTEGDVLPAADFSRDEYPEDSNLVKELRAIEDYDRSIYFGTLAKRGYKDPDTKKEGGVAVCRREAFESLERARMSYLSSQNINIIKNPGIDAPSDNIDEYYQGIQLWYAFRENMHNPDVRSSRQNEIRDTLHHQKIS